LTTPMSSLTVLMSFHTSFRLLSIRIPV